MCSVSLADNHNELAQTDSFLFFIIVRLQNENAPEDGNKAVFITGMLHLSCQYVFFQFGPVMKKVHRIPSDKPKKRGSFQYSCVICSALNVY